MERKEVEELREFKAQTLKTPLEKTEITRWSEAYWSEKLRKSKYQIDQEKLRDYFPTLAAQKWLFAISSDLYGIDFKPVKVKAWQSEVEYYDVVDKKTGKLLGGLYMDKFPREGKYGHAAVWGVYGGSTLTNRLPVSALVTNFNRKGLNSDELETFVHEFGHLTNKKCFFNFPLNPNMFQSILPQRVLRELANDSEILDKLVAEERSIRTPAFEYFQDIARKKVEELEHTVGVSPVLEEAPPMMGGGSLYEPSEGRLNLVGFERGKGLLLSRYNSDLELIDTKTLDIQPGYNAYWPQAFTRIGTHYLIGYMLQDDRGWSSDLGDVWIAVFDADWNLVQDVQVSQNTPPNGGMRPAFARREGSDELVVLYDINVSPTAFLVKLDLAALGVDGAEDTAHPDLHDSGSVDSTGETGGKDEGKDGGKGCGGCSSGSSPAMLFSLLLGLLLPYRATRSSPSSSR